MAIDRYKLHQFYQGKETEPNYLNIQDIIDEVFKVKELQIVTLAMDLPGKKLKQRKELEANWIAVLPTLDNVKVLSVRHRVKQDFFEAICKMKNLERLIFWTSTVEDISNIKSLTKLKHLKLWSFSRLKDISPLLSLKHLSVLSIDNCFKVENYDVLGKMTQLIGLELCGDTFAPKNLRLNSLKPFETLKKLKHLDLSSASVIDKSYESILKMTSLERFDINVIVPKATRELIKSRHKCLQAGSFMDWDYDNKKFYEGKVW
ncbi:MAG: leucine-rich repeat domain-containing protein [Chitinophagaceae bacterium]